ncbi:MAG: glycosyltransferase family 4 protein [Egibacteraceae bacterium]
MIAGPTPRILLVTAVTHGHKTYAETLLTAFRERDVPVEHLPVPRSPLTRLAGLRIRQVRGLDLQAVRRQLALDLQIRRCARWAMRSFDLVHVMPHGFAHAFALAKGIERACLSVALDSTGRLMREEFGTHRWQERLRERFERTTFAAADHLVCLSDWARQSVLGYGVDPERIDVIPPSAPLASFRARTLRNGDQLPRIAFVGAPWRRKGGDLLLRWHQEQWAERAELHILCRDVPATVRACRNVIVHEPISRGEVLEVFLPACDLFVLPTRRDQSPWVVAEAATAGLPVVAFGVGGIAELIVDGETGFLVPEAQERLFVAAVDTLLRDPTRREAMSRRAARHALQVLSAKANFGRLVDTLMALAQRSRP